MKLTAELVAGIREQYPALQRKVGNVEPAYFDGPGGTQVPQCVIDAVSHYLAYTNANHGGVYPTSVESDAMLAQAHDAVGTFLGTSDPGTVIFGANMTSLTMTLARSLGKTWQQSDEVVVTRLDHDANISPWLLAAEDAGAVVRFCDISTIDCTLDLDHLRSLLNEKTKLVAVGCASNLSGTLNPITKIARWAHEVGALCFADAVHIAPHMAIDVQQLECDFLACSPYKFFGPHLGVLWGRRELLEKLPPYKVRPNVDSLPDRWMAGTQNHESIAGAMAAVNYLADLGRQVTGDPDLALRQAIESSFVAIAEYENELTWQLLDGLAALPKYSVWGITDRARQDERVPTVSFTHESLSNEAVATKLASQGLFLWHGDHFAMELSQAIGRDGTVRAGIVHFNTAAEVDRLIHALSEL